MFLSSNVPSCSEGNGSVSPLPSDSVESSVSSSEEQKVHKVLQEAFESVSNMLAMMAAEQAVLENQVSQLVSAQTAMEVEAFQPVVGIDDEFSLHPIDGGYRSEVNNFGPLANRAPVIHSATEQAEINVIMEQVSETVRGMLHDRAGE